MTLKDNTNSLTHMTTGELRRARDRFKRRAIDCQLDASRFAAEARESVDDIAYIDAELEQRAGKFVSIDMDRVAEIDRDRDRIKTKRDMLHNDSERLYIKDVELLEERKMIMGGPLCSGGCGSIDATAARPDSPYTCAVCFRD